MFKYPSHPSLPAQVHAAACRFRLSCCLPRYLTLAALVTVTAIAAAAAAAAAAGQAHEARAKASGRSAREEGPMEIHPSMEWVDIGTWDMDIQCHGRGKETGRMWEGKEGTAHIPNSAFQRKGEEEEGKGPASINVSTKA